MFLRLCLALTLAIFSIPGLAQQSPEIDDELRALLRETVANADSFEDRFDAEVWLVQKDGVLKKFVKDAEYRLFLLKEVHKAATQAELPPEFVLAVIHVESYFDRYAVSSVGAQGLMQIMPFWKKEIGRESDNLIDPVTNLRYGCTILKYYLDKSDNNWAEALARYNGSYGKMWYPIRVMDAWDDYWR
jgi:soluble lytic murein transglycosylase-like protein